MQSEIPEPIQISATDTLRTSHATNHHHGISRDGDTATPLLARDEQHGSPPHSGSEWSFSTSPGRSPTESHDSWLIDAGGVSPKETELYDDTTVSPEDKHTTMTSAKRLSKARAGYSPLQDFPEGQLAG